MLLAVVVAGDSGRILVVFHGLLSGCGRGFGACRLVGGGVWRCGSEIGAVRLLRLSEAMCCVLIVGHVMV